MASNVFLSSVFKGLHEIRHKIWMDIQKRENLHCISFQSDHVTHYPKSILADTVSEIKKCDFFVFIVGPEYGTVIDKLSGVDTKNVKDYEKLSFSHFEFECAMEVLEELTVEEKPEERFFYAILKNHQAGQNVDTNLTNYLSSITNFKNLGATCNFLIKQKKTNGQQESYEIDNSSKLFFSLSKCLDEWNKIAVVKARKKFLDKSIKVADHVNIVGWSGIEDKKLYSKLQKQIGLYDDTFSFLMMDRSIIDFPPKAAYVPRLGHNPLPFDFILADVEIVPHYIENAICGSFSVPYDNTLINQCLSAIGDNGLCELINRPKIRSVFTDKHGTPIAIPIMFGFNEIIVKPTTGLADATPVTYSSFSLSSLLAANHQVALWDWWSATFPALLMANIQSYTPDKDPDDCDQYIATLNRCKSVEQFTILLNRLVKENESLYEQVIRCLTNSMIKTAKKFFDENDNTNRILIYSNLEQLRLGLENSDFDVLFGGTSALLPCIEQNKLRNYHYVIPEEGIFMWLNCICKVAGSDINGSLRSGTLSNWLNAEEQLRLAIGEKDSSGNVQDLSKKRYVGLPVIRKAFDDLRNLSEKNDGIMGILHIGIKVVYTFRRRFLGQTYRVNQSALSLCGYFKEKLFGRSKKIGIFFFYYIKEEFDPVLFLFLARQYFHRRPVFSFAIVITPMVVIKHNQVQSFLRDMVL